MIATGPPRSGGGGGVGGAGVFGNWEHHVCQLKKSDSDRTNLMIAFDRFLFNVIRGVYSI